MHQSHGVGQDAEDEYVVLGCRPGFDRILPYNFNFGTEFSPWRATTFWATSRIVVTRVNRFLMQNERFAQAAASLRLTRTRHYFH